MPFPKAKKPAAGVWAVALLAAVPAAQADFSTIFTENWEAETVGDNADQLTNWQYESDYGNGLSTDAEIMYSPGLGQFLSMNPPNPPPWGEDASMGIRTQSSFATALPGQILSIKSKVALDQNDGGGAGTIGFSQANAALYGYGLAVSLVDKAGGGYNAVMEIFEFNGSLTGNGYGYEIVEVDPTDSSPAHTFELQAAAYQDSIEFQVYYDDTLVPALNRTDATPVDFGDEVTFSLASNLGQLAYFDDFVAAEAPIPEPASLTLLALGGLAVIRRRR